MGVCKRFIDGVYNLLLGLKVTAACLPQRAVTLQYPEERWEMPERSRGIVVLLSDKETGKLNCTACLLCQKACPTGAIKIERDRGEDKKWYPTSFTVDNTICCFCGLCEEACNFAATKMAAMYEFSVFDQSELVFDMKKLQELGRDVPYTPRPKKKPVPKKPAPAKQDDTGVTEPEAKTEPAPETMPKTEETEKERSGDAEAKPAAQPASPDQDRQKEQANPDDKTQGSEE